LPPLPPAVSSSTLPGGIIIVVVSVVLGILASSVAVSYCYCFLIYFLNEIRTIYACFLFNYHIYFCNNATEYNRCMYQFHCYDFFESIRVSVRVNNLYFKKIGVAERKNVLLCVFKKNHNKKKLLPTLSITNRISLGTCAYRIPTTQPYLV
jgi:hypothetical protein